MSLTPCYVLLVDDNAVVRWGLQRMLARLDPPPAVVEAADGAEAVGLGLGLAWDLIILNPHLPDLCRPPMRKLLRQVCPSVPDLTLPLDGWTEFAHLYVAASGAVFMMKETGPDQVLAILRYILKSEPRLELQAAPAWAG